LQLPGAIRQSNTSEFLASLTHSHNINMLLYILFIQHTSTNENAVQAP